MTEQDSTNTPQSMPKWCPHCEGFREPEAFYKNSSNRDGLDSFCKVHKRLYMNGRLPKRRSDWLRQKYGLTLRQYEKMVWDQDGLCAICRQPQRKGSGTRLVVDHDHKTGAVRGLLCSSCNTGLGHFEDNIERLQRAIEYLNRCRKLQ